MTGFRFRINTAACEPLCFTIIAFNFSITEWIASFDGRIRSLPQEYSLIFCPRKLNPSVMWVIFVFFADNCSPLCARKSSIRGFTLFSRISLLEAVTTKSSAKRIRWILWWLFLRQPSVLMVIPNALSIASSRPSRVMLARVGEITPPCGVPSVVGNNCLFSINPAFNHCCSTFLSIGIFCTSH